MATTNTKGDIATIGLYAAVGFGLWMIFGGKLKAANLPGGAGASYNPPGDGSSLGVSATQIQSIANTQFSAMADIFTNEALLFSSLQNLSGADLIRVFQAFGLKPYAGTGSWFGVGYSLDLFGWYKEELGGSDLIKMRQLWSKSNLNITF
jgi:hypothetical protein